MAAHLTVLLIAGGLAEGATLYVWTNSPSPMAPFTNWTTAARTIQDALDAALDGDEIWATNGVYASGGAVVPGFGATNRVAITNAVTVRSVNGPAVTIIRGRFHSATNPPGPTAVRCVYNNGGTLIGFTLTDGATAAMPHNFLVLSGGGAFLHYGILSNCVIAGNVAANVGGGVVTYDPGSLISHCVIVSNAVVTTNFFGSGGGVYLSSLDIELRNCVIAYNRAEFAGGGVHLYDGRMDACTVANNVVTNPGSSTAIAGGLYVERSNSVANTIVFGNTASGGFNEYHAVSNAFSFSCATPAPPGLGNFSADPKFAGAGDFHLQAGSPCINAGTNQAWMTGGVDMDGDPRILGGRVDVGADEVADLAAFNISKPTNHIVVMWTAPMTNAFRMQFRTNLLSGSWSNIGGVTSAVGGVITTIDTNPLNPSRLYRLITN